MMVGHLRTYRLYENEQGKTSLFESELVNLKDELLLNAKFRNTPEQIMSGHTTFRGIKVQNVFENRTPIECDLINQMDKRKEIPLERFSKKLVELIEDYIDKTCNRSKTIIVPHSSGFDSRVLSGTFKKLGIHPKYLCWEPESTLYTKIMDYLEVPQEDRWVHLSNVEPGEYQTDLLQFDQATKYTNGPTIPLACCSYVYGEYIKAKGINPDNVQLYRGSYFNEIFNPFYKPKEFAGSNLAAFMIYCHYFPLTSQLAHENILNMFFPILSYDVLAYLKEYKPNENDANIVRTSLVKTIDPQLYALERHAGDGPPWDYRDGGKHIPGNIYRKMSPGSYGLALSDFKKSWYAKNVDGNITDGTNAVWYVDWWQRYMSAAYVQTFVNAGKKIRVVSDDLPIRIPQDHYHYTAAMYKSPGVI